MAGSIFSAQQSMHPTWVQSGLAQSVALQTCLMSLSVRRVFTHAGKASRWAEARKRETMHEHKFFLIESGAICQHEGCMYVFSTHDILKILADIANSVSAQQSVQRTCATCGSNHFKDVPKITSHSTCVSCGASR